MSELKAVHAFDVYEAYTKTGDDDAAQVYLKSEADKVIADLEESHKREVGQLLIEIAEQKSEIERLEILCADYRHDCDNLAISNEQVKRAASTILKKMNHHKYKRCLAMAAKCEAWIRLDVSPRHTHRFIRWYKIWLAISEKFKPNNSTAQQGKGKLDESDKETCYN